MRTDRQLIQLIYDEMLRVEQKKPWAAGYLTLMEALWKEMLIAFKEQLDTDAEKQAIEDEES